MGMAFGYVQKSGIFSGVKSLPAKIAADLCGVTLLLASVISSAFFLAKLNPGLSDYNVEWSRPWLCAFGSGALFLLLTLNRDGCLSRFLRLPLVAYVGQVSYVIYLVHFFMIPHVSFPSAAKTFCAIFAASFGLAAVWNEWFDKPLQQLASRLGRKKKSSI